MVKSSSIISGEIRPADQYTVSLPVLGGVPYKIDCSNEMLGVVLIDAKVDFYWVMAENNTQAAVLLGAAGTRFSAKAGFYEISVSTARGHLYFMSQGAVEANGLSYTHGYLVG